MKFNGAGSTQRNGQLTATLPVRVAQVLPNGDLYVEGSKVVMVSSEEHHLYISGIVRRLDIADDDSVPSSRLADAEIEFTGRGDVSDQQRRGWLSYAPVTVQARFDAAIHTWPDWVGFVFPDVATRDSLLPAYAARLARLADAETIVVLSIGDVEGRRSITGQVITVDSPKPQRTASVGLEPVEPSAERLRGRGAFLAGRIPRVPDDDPEPTGSLGGEGAFSYSRAAIVVGGIATGVGGVAVGAWMLSINGHGTCSHDPCAQLYSTKVEGIGFMVVGAALLGGAIYYGMRHHRATPLVSVAPDAVDVGVSLNF